MTENDKGPVGYGRPPIHSRFKPGQSGNPRGRPRHKSLKADLQAALAEPAPDGSGSKQAALTRQLVDNAVAGDLAAMRLILAATASRADEPDEDEQIGADDQALVDDFENQQAQQAAGGDACD